MKVFHGLDHQCHRLVTLGHPLQSIGWQFQRAARGHRLDLPGINAHTLRTNPDRNGALKQTTARQPLGGVYLHQFRQLNAAEFKGNPQRHVSELPFSGCDPNLTTQKFGRGLVQNEGTVGDLIPG